MKKYDKYKDSGINWIGEIPEHWEILSLKHCVSTKITDGPHETPKFILNGVPFISAEAIQNGSINFKSKRGCISEKEEKRFAIKCKPKKNDIFIVKSGSTTGKIGYVHSNINFNIWSPLALVRAKTNYSSRCLFHFLQSDCFQDQVKFSWSFGTQPNIGMNILENLKIILPLVKEQVAIVEHIETETGRINIKAEKTKKLIDLLKEYKTALVSEVVTGKVQITE